MREKIGEGIWRRQMRNSKERDVKERNEKRQRGERLKARARASWKRPRKTAPREHYGGERDEGAPVGGKKREKLLRGKEARGPGTLKKSG